MKIKTIIAILTTFLVSCLGNQDSQGAKLTPNTLIGTWKLISGTIIDKSDTVLTDYTQDRSFIKIINDSHFAFFLHDLNKGKDSSAVFTSGGGTYSLDGMSYIEHLEYCSDRNWEGTDFEFKVDIKNDTLVQSGVEVVESAGINRINIEKYSRIKK